MNDEEWKRELLYYRMERIRINNRIKELKDNIKLNRPIKIVALLLLTIL